MPTAHEHFHAGTCRLMLCADGTASTGPTWHWGFQDELAMATTRVTLRSLQDNISQGRWWKW